MSSSLLQITLSIIFPTVSSRQISLIELNHRLPSAVLIVRKQSGNKLFQKAPANDLKRSSHLFHYHPIDSTPGRHSCATVWKSPVYSFEWPLLRDSAIVFVSSLVGEFFSGHTIQGYVEFERRKERAPIKSCRRPPGQFTRHSARTLLRVRFGFDFNVDCLVTTVSIVLTDFPKATLTYIRSNIDSRPILLKVNEVPTFTSTTSSPRMLWAEHFLWHSFSIQEPTG